MRKSYYTIPIFKMETGVVAIDVPAIINVDRPYIKDITARAVIDIENSNFDSAITKSRTLLEETFYYVIELKGEMPTTSGSGCLGLLGLLTVTIPITIKGGGVLLICKTLIYQGFFILLIGSMHSERSSQNAE